MLTFSCNLFQDTIENPMDTTFDIVIDTVLDFDNIYLDEEAYEVIVENAEIKVEETISDKKPKNKILSENNTELIETEEIELPIITTLFSYGIVTYKMSDTMYVGESSTINLAISAKDIQDKIVKEIETFENNNVTSDIIRIGNIMKVELIDGSNKHFDIVNITNSKQHVEQFDYTRWEWEVTPLLKGKHSLKLAVYVVFDDGSNKVEKVYKNFINVYSKESIFQTVGKFLKANWEFFMGSVIIPMFVFFYMRKRKKKLKEKL
jgi:hypothetical protein